MVDIKNRVNSCEWKFSLMIISAVEKPSKLGLHGKMDVKLMKIRNLVGHFACSNDYWALSFTNDSYIVFFRHLDQNVCFNDLFGFNNTGNVCE